MSVVGHSLLWLFLAIAVASMAVQWLQGIETSAAVWWAVAILVSGEAAFVSGDARIRLMVGALVTVALVGLLTETPGLMTPLGQGVARLIGIVVLIHVVMLMSGYGRREA